ncbi:nucleolar protein 9 isoform X2 [Rhinatrema bivittatum]|uniref:nucleolar protein 9 isoform X2 n=1 Tax=Rhinatrema bivittatum TaxID=194408 RepID=UPI00112DA5CB|nr:nucleolar protein 9 isoform X2 [Rhinatrema bivittatum]
MGIKEKPKEDKKRKRKKRQNSAMGKPDKVKKTKSYSKKGSDASSQGRAKPSPSEAGEPPSEGSRKAEKLPKGLKQQDARGPKDLQQPKLDPKTVGYFRRVHETLQQDFDSEEEKRLFLRNVFEEVKGIEPALATDTLGSVVLQRLLELASPPQALHLLSILGSHLSLLACHRSGAHVMQTALLQYPRFREGAAGAEEDEVEAAEGEAAGTPEGAVVRLCAGVKERFLEYSRNTHGSFVVRTLLQVLAGTVLKHANTRKGAQGCAGRKDTPESKAQTAFEVPESFLEQLQEITSCFQENIAVFVTNKIASLVLQVAVQVLHRKLPLVCAELCDAVLGYLSSRNSSTDCSSLLVFLKDQTCSRLLEEILLVMDRKRLGQLFRSHFRGQLLMLAAHPIANFTVQRLLAALPSKKLFAVVFDELSPGVEDVLAKGHMGVMTELIAACRRHRCRQEEGLSRLLEVFHCAEPASRRITCSPLFLSLLTYEVYYGKEEAEGATEEQGEELKERRLQDVNYHGSLLMQHLLHFSDPAPVLLSLAAMTDADLVTLACSQAGSHVFDALLASSSVSEKQRKKILGKFKGHYVQLACSKSGSRVLDGIWSGATLGTKQNMAQELAQQEQELQRDPFGHHIVRNFALTHFLKRRRDWEEHQAAEDKRRRMFAEILED